MILAVLLASWGIAAQVQAPSGAIVATTTVALIPGESDNAAFTEAVYAALSRDGFIAPVRALRQGIDVDETPVVEGDRERARAALQEARARFRELDLSEAIVLAERAIDEIVRLARPEDQSETLFDALVFAATVELSERGRTPRAADWLLWAVRTEPNRTSLNAALHPPSVLAAFADARARDTTAPTFQIGIDVVSVIPIADAEIVVDGTTLRQSDHARVALRAGPHLITARSANVRNDRAVSSMWVNVADNDALAFVLVPDGVVEKRRVASSAMRNGIDTKLPLLLSSTRSSAVVVLTGERRVLHNDARTLLPDTAQTPEQISGAIVQILRPTDDGLSAKTWAAIAGGALVLTAGIVVSGVAWFVPFGPLPAPPARPVEVVCCTSGQRN
jgi:hypothetical protein